MNIPKELTCEQVSIIQETCTDGTLKTLATIEAGFASWGHANFLASEVVRLAELVNKLPKNTVTKTQLHTK
jgi:hypothetical protein